MESVLTAFIIILLILFGGLTLFQDSLTAQETLHISWQEMETRLTEQAHTDLTPISAETKSSGSVIELVLRNDGDTRLVDFANWDIIVQYYTASSNYNIAWLAYDASAPTAGEWTVVGIYSDTANAISEQFEPQILNPGEEMLLRLRVVPPIGPNTTNLATIATDNGTTTATLFTR
ncbi:MAG: hypothetical protein H6658_04440 [Ardenticatenaceae bacterium]|nr:hypothetical protein [Ardenticatenaceae bacterium]